MRLPNLEDYDAAPDVDDPIERERRINGEDDEEAATEAMADDGLGWTAGSEDAPVRTVVGRRACKPGSQYCSHNPVCKAA